MPMSHDEVYEKVKKLLAEALAVDEDEVTPQAKIISDLGAESIDFLDITFQLEKTFGIKIPKGELRPDDLFTNPEYVTNGKVTPKGLTELEKRMSFADLTEFKADPDINKFGTIFTVETLVRFVESKLTA